MPANPYFVFVSQASRRHDVEIWPIALNQTLPEVSIPLLPDEAVVLDLQKALSVIYDIIGYDELIDYMLPPPGLLSESEIEWVVEQLRAQANESEYTSRSA